MTNAEARRMQKSLVRQTPLRPSSYGHWRLLRHSGFPALSLSSCDAIQRPRRGVFQVRRHVGLGVAEGPGEAAEEDVLEDRARPDVLAVAHRRVEDAALALHPRPRLGVRLEL